MSSYNLKIITLDEVFFDGQVEILTVRGVDGDFQILPRHADLIAVAMPDDISFVTEQGELHAFISRSLLKVMDGNVTIIADTAEWPEDIDLGRAEEAEKRARETLMSRESANTDITKVELALMRAMGRKKTSKHRG
ncbi:MAG TPA: ATP synthase F1 subunit epsilon [Clostridia bacterium]|nr:ATP synthase F1 subunit epsilon [Clostridia bacterium]